MPLAGAHTEILQPENTMRLSLGCNYGRPHARPKLQSRMATYPVNGQRAGRSISLSIGLACASPILLSTSAHSPNALKHSVAEFVSVLESTYRELEEPEPSRFLRVLHAGLEYEDLLRLSQWLREFHAQRQQAYLQVLQQEGRRMLRVTTALMSSWP